MLLQWQQHAELKQPSVALGQCKCAAAAHMRRYDHLIQVSLVQKGSEEGGWVGETAPQQSGVCAVAIAVIGIYGGCDLTCHAAYSPHHTSKHHSTLGASSPAALERWQGNEPNWTAFATSPAASQGECQCMLICIGKQDQTAVPNPAGSNVLCTCMQTACVYTAGQQGSLIPTGRQ